MATESMKIVIGADLGPAIAETGKLSNALDDVSKSVRGAASSFAQIAPPLSTVSKSVEKIAPAARGASAELDRFRNASKGAADAQKILPSSLDKTAKALSKITPGANAAGFALSNVGRVAQDLPFGFIGIQNNLNPLLESFQRLKAETGSSKAAFKALGSSLIGAGGIGLALSLVSSAVLIFQNGIGGFGKKAKEAKEAADELAKSIRSIAAVEGEATAGVQGQLAQVNALASAVADSNVPYEQRKRALEELKEINKAYFNDLKIEDAATGQLTKTVEEYTKALVNSAIQKQFVDEIAKVAKAAAESDEKIRVSRDKLTRTQEALNNVERTAPTGVRDIEAKQNQRRLTALDAIKKAEQELAVVNENTTKLLEQEVILKDRLNKAVEAGLKFKDLDTKSDKKQEDLLKKRLDALEKIRDATEDATTRVGLQEAIFELQVKIALRDQGKNQLSKGEVDKQILGFKRELQDEFDKQAIELEAIPKVRFSDVQRVEIPTDIESKIAKATGFDKKIPEITIPQARIKLLGIEKGSLINATEAIINDLNKAIKQTISNGIVDAFSGIGEAFGEALAAGGEFGDGLKAAAKSILSIMGSVLQEVGKQVIIAAVAIKLLKSTLEKFAITNPGLAIAAGIGLVALGAVLKNIKFDGPKFGDGGIVTGPVIGQIGERFKPEVIIPLERLPQMLRGISGDAGSGVQIIPFINNEGLALAVKRGDRRAGRKF